MVRFLSFLGLLEMMDCFDGEKGGGWLWQPQILNLRFLVTSLSEAADKLCFNRFTGLRSNLLLAYMSIV